MILSVDPGKRLCGCALWREDGTLLSAWLTSITSKKFQNARETWGVVGLLKQAVMHEVVHRTGAISHVVVEFPQVYRRTQSRGNPQDLIDVAAFAGAMSGLAPTTQYLPRQWKKQIPKAKKGEVYIVERRVRAKLSNDEWGRVERAGARTHNIMDAIGIGLHYLREQGIR